jgi:ribosomal protein S18 acetylase RimI-like enzyme
MSDYGRIHPERGTQTSTYREMLMSDVGTRIYASVWVGNQRVAVGVLSWVRAYGGIYCMATHPDYRGHGMATSIVSTLITHGQGRGVKHVFLQVAGENSAAQTVYRRCGFEIAYRYWYRYLE